MDIIKIDGMTTPCPSSLTFSEMTLVSGESRNSKGRLKKQKIADKVRLEVEWSKLTESELSTLLMSLRKNEFYVTYKDPVLNSYRTAVFYSGDRTLGVQRYDSVTGKVEWIGTKATIIEC